MPFGRRGGRSGGGRGSPHAEAKARNEPGARADVGSRTAGMSPKLKRQLARIAGIASFMLLCVYGPPLALRALQRVIQTEDERLALMRPMTVTLRLHDASREPSPIERDVTSACVPTRKRAPSNGRDGPGDFKPGEVGDRAPIARWIIEKPGQPLRLCLRL